MSCVFCDVVAGRVAASLVLDDDAHVAFLDHRPLFHGHVLLVPRAHHELLEQLPAEAVAPLFAQARRLSAAVKVALEAEGTFLAINNGVSQSVPHLHVHVVPRRKGDGLKGFFWPRTKYAGEAARDEVAARIRAALE